MRVAIVGAGFAGLSAAYDLARAGHRVVLFEASPEVGGLASGFQVPGWEWKLERFYHHVFTSDRAILELTREIGARDLLLLARPTTAYWCPSHGAHPFDCPAAVMRYPHLRVSDRLRVGGAVLLLRLRRDWRRLERTTAEQWLCRAMGARAYDALWRPLLEGKFGRRGRDVNMAWFWARIAARTPRLGYFAGGFAALAERLAQRVREAGGEVRLGAPVRLIRRLETSAGGGARLAVVHSSGEERCDAALATVSPALLERIAPELPGDYARRLRELESLGAVVLVLALDRPLLRNAYWLNLPAGRFPFLALVEHTKLVSPRHYGGQHLLYLASYAHPGNELFRLSLDDLLERFLPALREIEPSFEDRWVQGAWLHREPYAQPVALTGHSRCVPSLETPIAGLFWASMSHVYPWDRGTSFAVETGRRAAAAMLKCEPAPAQRRRRGGSAKV